MTLKTEIRTLAQHYAAELQAKIEARHLEMQADDTTHYMIYQLLGISFDDGVAIDLYQNTGRFLYRYAGSFLEKATMICFKSKFPDVESSRIANPFGNRPKSFEIDCLIGKAAYEIKWRDATTDGDHITKEHSRIKAIAAAGYIPIRLMYYMPNRSQAIRIQAAIQDLYKANNGFYYAGETAWKHLHEKTGVDLKTLLEQLASEGKA